jgi:hypothetical protein
MVSVAIPLVVLGSLYILNEQEKKKENFQEEVLEEHQKNLFLTGKSNSNKKEGFSNQQMGQTRQMNAFETAMTQPNSNYNNYNNSNQHTDKFFTPQVNKTNNNVSLMNGQVVNSKNFKHNNMQPFFGAKIRGATTDYNNTEAILDTKQGYGSQSFSKSEQAPLFKPDENVNLTHGTANNTTFIQSRMNESTKMNNVTLWEPQRVGPGLDQGYGTQNKDGVNTGGTDGNGGFNAGMMSRDTWMPKSVDELRVETNQKQTYDFNGRQGPAASHIQAHGSNGIIGKIEKRNPEKYYESGPNRWFTTTGAEQAPPIRSTQIMPMENRTDTTREYYGGGTNALSGNATYTDVTYEESKKQNLGALPFSNASAKGQSSANPNDYGSQNYKILPNNRTTVQSMPAMGGVFGMAKAAIAPLLDFVKPTRKENAIGNLRESGNVNGGPRTGHMYNDNDITKTTNREMTTGKIAMNYVNVQGQNQRTEYELEQHQPVQNQRDTTNKDYIGNGAATNTGLRPYNNAYAQRNNVNKTYESRTNQGSMSLFNNQNNISMNRDENVLTNNRQQLPTGGPNHVPSSQFIGEMNGPAGYDAQFNSSRMDAGLLSAFKNNPYTQSLNSSI